MLIKTAKKNLAKVAKDIASIPFGGAFDLTAALVTAGQALDDALEEGLREKYASLKMAMTYQEAVRILGLPSSSDIMPSEIQKAYKAKALKAHPDKGGTHEEMVALNAARDFLIEDARKDGYEEDADEAAAEAFLDEKFEGMKNGRGWWCPPNNLCLNRTMLGEYNLWVFTILPLFPERTAYNDSLKGIVIHPAWRSTQDGKFDLTVDMAKKVYVAAKSSPTVQETVRKELAWIETKFQVQIPASIEAKLTKDALAMATRRWGADRLRMKDQLIPLDGSKPRNLTMYDKILG